MNKQKKHFFVVLKSHPFIQLLQCSRGDGMQSVHKYRWWEIVRHDRELVEIPTVQLDITRRRREIHE